VIVGGELRAALGWFLREYEVEVAIIQNALALPVNVPLGVALAEVLVETGLPAIGHHHDFAWERERFRHPQLPRLLHSVFPPPCRGCGTW